MQTVMKTQLKSAAINIGIVLVGIYILRRVPVVGGFVDKALIG